ncbi:MAG: GNAT family N-acetyltransferase [Microcystis sp. M015S2]|uniref:GNAT family N-acetyltransferase n=1 Tax=unclassified Microcystis TaxID=2643300 RepID=UPI00258EA30D|nr:MULTISPECIES: GNAT family N-acetyltransferase [unclassified Microcystis]MCA2710726.1 GNAT family N-acetyltransferase [Microcystis sp. M025S2]MCA2743620.1 GNAT family N-acetyltransferase [Microcystis sp. M015S2]MCA2761158.1 GNAT family N-acetyltransferase [Microcystis sp. M145S2]
MNYSIRAAVATDVKAIFDLIVALAAYQELSHLMTGNSQALGEHLFGEKPDIEALVAEVEGKIVGFALFFTNYSTFITKPGIYLEDIFVLPDYRSQGIGKALLMAVAKIAVARDAGLLEWTVLEWNQLAIDFYGKMGAKVFQEWQICRLTGTALTQLGNSDQ